MKLSTTEFTDKWCAPDGRFKINDDFLVNEGDLQEFSQDVRDSFGGQDGRSFEELVLPMAVTGGRWYLTSTGIWEARSNFNAQADPVNGPNWRLLFAPNNQPPTITAANISDATTAGRRMMLAADAKAQRALLNGISVEANQYGQGHPGFTLDDGAGSRMEWLFKAVLSLQGMQVVQQPAAPTSGQVDDTADTFSFLPNPAYPSFVSYKVGGLPGVTGAVYLDGTNSYVQGGRIIIKVVGAVAKGGLAVYVAGTGNVPDGKVLTNSEQFTGTATTTPPAGDTLAPNINLTVPAAGATLTVGQSVTLTVIATDNVAVTQVVFTNGATGAALGTAAKNGNTYTLPYTPTTAGPLTLTATASDAAGNSQAATVTVNVQAATNQPPSVTINGSSTATVGTSQNYQSVASDSDGTVALVELLLMADASTLTSFSVIGSDDSSPYVVGWQPSAAGTSYLRMRATDDKGATSFSSVLTVTVQAAGGPDFTVSVDNQRKATLTPPSGTAPTAYEYQFRPAPTVSAQRVVDMSQFIAPGESATDYEYQFRS